MKSLVEVEVRIGKCVAVSLASSSKVLLPSRSAIRAAIYMMLIMLRPPHMGQVVGVQLMRPCIGIIRRQVQALRPFGVFSHSVGSLPRASAPA